MDLVPRRARPKRPLGCAVCARSDLVRTAHALDLVLRFPGAIEVQLVEETFRIELAGVVAVGLSDEGEPSVAGKVLFGVGRLSDDLDVEVIDPVSRRRLGRLVPIVDRLKVNEARLLSRR